MRGEVVGINSQIYSRSGGFMGISFAIPIDEAMRVCRPAARQRPGHPRTHRRADRPGDQGSRRSRSVWASRTAHWCAASKPAGRPRKRASRPATSSSSIDGKPVDKAGDLPRIVGSTKPGVKAHAAGLPPRTATATSDVTVAEFEPEKPRRSPNATRSAPAAVAVRRRPCVSDLSETQKRELKFERRRACRFRRWRCCARWSARGRRDPVDRQHRGQRAPSSSTQSSSKLDKSRPVSVLVRRSEWVNYLVIRPAG